MPVHCKAPTFSSHPHILTVTTRQQLCVPGRRGQCSCSSCQPPGAGPPPSRSSARCSRRRCWQSCPMLQEAGRGQRASQPRVARQACTLESWQAQLNRAKSSTGPTSCPTAPEACDALGVQLPIQLGGRLLADSRGHFVQHSQGGAPVGGVWWGGVAAGGGAHGLLVRTASQRPSRLVRQATSCHGCWPQCVSLTQPAHQTCRRVPVQHPGNGEPLQLPR